MKIAKASVSPFDFEGLKITDYTAGMSASSSLAEITVLPGTRHRRAYSTRSDKYYYLISGRLLFEVEGEHHELRPGDACLISKGQTFSYRNSSQDAASLLLFHTPSFDPESEIFAE